MPYSLHCCLLMCSLRLMPPICLLFSPAGCRVTSCHVASTLCHFLLQPLLSTRGLVAVFPLVVPPLVHISSQCAAASWQEKSGCHHAFCHAAFLFSPAGCSVNSCCTPSRSCHLVMLLPLGMPPPPLAFHFPLEDACSDKLDVVMVRVQAGGSNALSHNPHTTTTSFKEDNHCCWSLPSLLLLPSWTFTLPIK